ncbi:hypothetical protein KVT40_001414 [Elsinoe batatas]|uniref:Zn(2)-C6 fungal-type domain-containing protein n=1 Tax=Elsinoe batatas TaxID=2601811 RepID=A0A8K0L6K5_9PEZI|nr:hypothetical protein KVT40_001414 [Elsinoe batatas]
MPADSAQRNEDGTGDLACTRCRERKIRCDRERPECSNCKRDPDTDCVYRHPAKRVNHLKLLCDSVEKLQDRLTTMESHFARSAGNVEPTGRAASASGTSVPPPKGNTGDEYTDDSEDDASDTGLDSSANSSEIHIFRSQIDHVDRWHGSSSLFVLCNRLKIRAMSSNKKGGDTVVPLSDLIQNLCDFTGRSDPFPAFSDQPLNQLVPKQQAQTAIEHFFRHVDYTTDLFVKDNLLANLDRLYSQPVQPHDEAWSVCFRVMVLLVLGLEISTQLGNGSDALFGNFARSFLPSRASMVNSRLVTTPRLINVQTLILLSVAAQQFDPLGWAELLFTHACTLARTMGLHHAQAPVNGDDSSDGIERSKVLQALYCRDKSLYISRGSVPWLPSYDSHLVSQVGAVAEKHTYYHSRVRLAIIQEDIYRLAHSSTKSTTTLSPKAQALLRRTEQKLDQYVKTFRVFDHGPPYALTCGHLIMDFLSTRILAYQHGTSQKHLDQRKSDARASCCLLLYVNGEKEDSILDQYKALTKCGVARRDSALAEDNSSPFTSALDAFSVPAFFILFEEVVYGKESSRRSRPISDLELLRKVSTTYTHSTRHMQSTSYHRKIAWIFDQLLSMIDLFKHKPGTPAPPALPAQSSMQDLVFSSPAPTQQHDYFNNIGGNLPLGDVHNFNLAPTPPSSGPSWDSLLSVLSNMGPSSDTDPLGTNFLSPDPFGQFMSNSLNGSANVLPPLPWPPITPGPSPGHGKRRRIEDDSAMEESTTRRQSQYSTSTEDLPFNLVT